MIGAGGVQILPVTRFANAETLLNLFANSGTVPGRVVPDANGLALALPQLRVPLPAGTALPAGTLVDARIVDQNGAKQLQLTPRASAPQSQSTPGPSPLLQAASVPPPAPAPASFVAMVLNQISATLPAAVTREQAIAILPRAEGLPRETVRALLEMFVGRERVGMIAAQVSEAIDAAVASGRLPAAVRENFAAIARRMFAETAAEFERVVAAARDALAGRASAGQLARPGANASVLDDLLALRDQITAHAESTGNRPENVLRLVDSLFERLEAGRMQNVRGFEAPYQFIELPLSKQTGFDRGQIHFFGDETRAADPEQRSYSVVFDLELSQLGPVWIALHAVHGTCTCVMRVASDTARAALTGASPALEDELRAAGYAGATVRTEAWDGDRVSALAAMSARFAGFEASA